MITLYFQTEPIDGIYLPNSLPIHLRNLESFYQNLFKSVKPFFITEMCDYFNIYYKRTTKLTYQNEIAYYHIEISSPEQALIYRNIFEYIDETPLNLIKDINSNLRLLLWFPNEGFSLRQPYFIDIIDYCCKDIGIPAHKVYLVFGDLNIKDNFKKYRKKNQYAGFNVYGMASYESTYNFEIDELIKQKKGPLLQDKFEKNWGIDRNKIFIFKNANPRPHRIYFASELYQRNLLDYSFYSWINRYYKPSIASIISELSIYTDCDTTLEKLNKSFIEFLNGGPYIIDFDSNNINDELNQRILINSHYLDSYFSFVTETIYEDISFDNVLFITEKIYQPIINYHPFIVAGPLNLLEYLKSCGYATFPELFDESYDREKDIKKRSQIILNNIANWCKNPKLEVYFSNEVRDKLIHNKNLFFTNKGKNDWIKVFNWLKQ